MVIFYAQFVNDPYGERRLHCNILILSTPLISVIDLMLIEGKLHTIAHLKALIRGIEHISGHGQAKIFRGQKISLKSTHFTS